MTDAHGARCASVTLLYFLFLPGARGHPQQGAPSLTSKKKKSGAVPAMVNLVKTSPNEWTRMWSMACLHNLAEDYCASSTGVCPWVQVSFAARGVEPDRRGQSDHNARVTVDSSSVRLSMHSQVLVHMLLSCTYQCQPRRRANRGFGVQGLIGLAVSMAAKGPSKYCPDSLSEVHSLTHSLRFAMHVLLCSAGGAASNIKIR